MAYYFEFLSHISEYKTNRAMVRRLERRHKLIIEPFKQQLQGAKVLDLACHDGRWSYALAQAGAEAVVGVEARQELIDRFSQFANTEAKKKVRLFCDDLFEFVQKESDRAEKYDIVALYGIFYHVMDHLQLLKMVKKLKPKLIIIDSEFITADNAIIQLLREDTSNPLNATGIEKRAKRAVVGVPSYKATEFMAEAIGYEVTWLSTKLLLGDKMEGVEDYFRKGRKIRGTCALTPRK